LEEKNVDLMFSAVRCINSLVSEPGVVGLDFADVKSVLGKNGRGYVGYGKATGEQPTIDAMNSAINSLKDTLHNSKRLLVCFFGWYENLQMLEVNEATTILQEASHPDAEIIWGVVTDITNQDFVEVIVISAE
jgi:cell division protein FtsZ